MSYKEKYLRESIRESTFAGNGKKPPIPAVRFDTNHFVVSDDLIPLWETAYPAVNVRVELAAAAAWAIANPKNWKSNWSRFLVSWLKRAQDRAAAVGAPGPVVGRKYLPTVKYVPPPREGS